MELNLVNAPATKWTAKSLMAKLRARYDERQWAFFENVPNGTGYSQKRTADAVAMNLWPSGGLALHGFELKVSRGDWLRELRQPEKASEVKRYCDFWWLVASSDDVAKNDSMPEGWGLMVVRNGNLVVEVDAPKLEAATLDRTFIAALVRKVARDFSTQHPQEE